jgi:hypothetical protein
MSYTIAFAATAIETRCKRLDTDQNPCHNGEIMYYADYAVFEQDIRDFFEKEKITHLIPTMPPKCAACGGAWDKEDEVCVDCGAKSDDQREPWFSWSNCDCCGSHLGGDREHAVGFNINDRDAENEWYEICSDCAYYIENGCLDDMSMLDVEATRDDAEEHETEAGLFIQPPDDAGVIRVEDCYGNTVDTYEPGSGEWWEWISVFKEEVQPG